MRQTCDNCGAMKGDVAVSPGIRAAGSALESGAARRLLIAAGTRNKRVLALADFARKQGVAVTIVSAAELERVSESARHQGVAAETTTIATDWRSLLNRAGKGEGGGGFVVVGLDGVNDPRNLGSVLRTARAFGAAGVFAPRSRCAPLSAAARKAAAGAAEVLPYVLVGNLARALEDLRARDVLIVGAAEDGTGDAATLADRGTGGRGWCWVLGGEGGGLRRLTREKCDAVVRIPTAPGPAGCLNVSVACGVCLAAHPGGFGS